MLKCEFEERINHEIAQEDYQKIETVYSYYPTNKEISKDEIAELYLKFGMRIFFDMLPRAQKIKELELQISEAQKIIAEL